MAFQPSADQLASIQRQKQQFSQGNVLYGGNIGASNPNTNAVAQAKTTALGGSQQGGSGGSSNQQPQGQQAPSQEDLMREINGIYDASNNYLNQAEGALRNDYPNILNDINAQFDASRGQLQGAYDTGSQKLGQLGDQAAYANESAQAQARRLYNELRQGYSQRFGGASSAGEAANQLAGVEQQRQQGQTQRGYQDVQTNLANQAKEILTNYQTGLQNLEVQKNQSLNQANRDFQNKLLQISQNRAANESAKAQARLSALQDLRNQIFSINQQTAQFQQTLDAQKQASIAQVSQSQSGIGQAVGTAGQATDQYGQQAAQRPTSDLQAGGRAFVDTVPQSYIGQITQPRRQDDPYSTPNFQNLG